MQHLTFSTAPSLGDTVRELSSGALYVGCFGFSTKYGGTPI